MPRLAQALLHCKCPRCRNGKMFRHPWYALTRFHLMHSHCPWCGIGLEPEPGFYQGAMYVSYGFTVAGIATVGVLLYLLGHPSPRVYVGVSVTMLVVLAPLNYRYSRVLYLYWFGGLTQAGNTNSKP
jgi:uncharacterized protein (DUF983 family)